MKRKTIRILSLVIALCLLLGTAMGCTGTTTAEATATAGPESTETTDATEAPAAPGELPPSSDGASPDGTPPDGMGNPPDGTPPGGMGQPPSGERPEGTPPGGFGQMQRFLELVDSYRMIKPEIGCDCYPYDAFSTGLGSTTYDDGWMERYGCDYSVVELAEGKYKGQRCTKEIFDEVRRDHPECMTICYVMQQDEVDMAFEHAGVMLGSDGTLSEGQGHPRAAGAFPRFIHRYVKSGKLSMYEAISRITEVPARQLNLMHKGRLNVGADADIVVFDPERIEDKATFAQPLLPPVGIDYVIVNGVIAAKDSKILSFDSGRSIRKQ